MYILGISAFYHDSAASLIKNGEIVAAAQEERFTRQKNDSSFPHRAIKYCINEAKINASDIIKVLFYEKPFLKFERLKDTYLAFAPQGFQSFSKAMPLWIKEKLFQKRILMKNLTACLMKQQIERNVYFLQSIIFHTPPVHSIHHLFKGQQYRF